MPDPEIVVQDETLGTLIEEEIVEFIAHVVVRSGRRGGREENEVHGCPLERAPKDRTTVL